MVACRAAVLRWTVWRSTGGARKCSHPTLRSTTPPTAGDEARSLINGVVRRAPRAAAPATSASAIGVTSSAPSSPSRTSPTARRSKLGSSGCSSTRSSHFRSRRRCASRCSRRRGAKKLVANAERDAKAQQAHVREARQQPPDELDETILWRGSSGTGWTRSRAATSECGRGSRVGHLGARAGGAPAGSDRPPQRPRSARGACARRPARALEGGDARRRRHRRLARPHRSARNALRVHVPGQQRARGPGRRVHRCRARQHHRCRLPDRGRKTAGLRGPIPPRQRGPHREP